MNHLNHAWVTHHEAMKGNEHGKVAGGRQA